MRIVPVESNGKLTVDAPIPDTVAGRDALAEIRSGLFRGLSVEFRAVRQSVVAGIRRIAQATLTGAALCDDPAYSGATVEARRRPSGSGSGSVCSGRWCCDRPAGTGLVQTGVEGVNRTYHPACQRPACRFQGAFSVRSSAAYQACLNLISDAASTAELTGEHSEVLQPRLGAIARQMVDLGQSAFELVITLDGRLELLPVEITNVTGQADEDSWVYTLSRSGPASTMSAVGNRRAS